MTGNVEYKMRFNAFYTVLAAELFFVSIKLILSKRIQLNGI